MDQVHLKGQGFHRSLCFSVNEQILGKLSDDDHYSFEADFGREVYIDVDEINEILKFKKENSIKEILHSVSVTYDAEYSGQRVDVERPDFLSAPFRAKFFLEKLDNNPEIINFTIPIHLKYSSPSYSVALKKIDISSFASSQDIFVPVGNMNDSMLISVITILASLFAMIILSK